MANPTRTGRPVGVPPSLRRWYDRSFTWREALHRRG